MTSVIDYIEMWWRRSWNRLSNNVTKQVELWNILEFYTVLWTKTIGICVCSYIIPWTMQRSAMERRTGWLSPTCRNPSFRREVGRRRGKGRPLHCRMADLTCLTHRPNTGCGRPELGQPSSPIITCGEEK